jgi:uncharacterized coiled-coil protein SlyX
MTRASVLIPIHNKPTTLPLAVDTVLRQSVQDLEVILIGDGVTDAVRTVVSDLVERDERVRFLDLPKGPHHGERYRHDAIEAARSDAIFYLCDDDLLMPDHVADLLELLADHDLVQCLNGRLTPAGGARLYAGDLADPDCVALHLRDDLLFNIVGITGTAHTRRAYVELDDRWDTTPAGHWPDHWQFRKLMRRPGFRGATSARMTALQFPTSDDGRDTWDDEARVAEIVPWHALTSSPGGQEEIDRLVREGARAQLAEDRVRTASLVAELTTAYADLAAAGARLTEVDDRAATAYADLAATREGLTAQQAHQAELVRAHDEVVAGLWREIDTLQGHVSRLAQIRSAQEEKIAALRERLRTKDETIRRLRDRTD